MVSGPYYLGVDLGGTQLRMGAVTQDGRLAKDVISVSTGRGFGPEDLRRTLRDLAARMRSALDGEVAALGFGTAGVVGHGPLSQCDNLPLLNGVVIEDLVRDAAGCPVALENDARCFTLAEARYGAGRGARDVCGITLGTGVGCGVLAGGGLLRGAASQAGEVWRIPLRGQHLEHFLSGAGVVRGYAAAGGAPDPGLDAARVEERARVGESAARSAWRAFGEDLALLCHFVIALLDPAVLVIGGSLSRASDFYKPVLASRLEGRATLIADAELGPAAGVIGAAALNIGY
jgi:glucokinase